MKVNIYTIYDKVSEECGPVFQAKNDVVAHRAFKHLISDTPNVNLDDIPDIINDNYNKNITGKHIIIGTK